MPTPGPASAAWQLQLLGGLQATRDDALLARFPSRAVAMLFARLALFPRRRHGREELIELLWPGVDAEVGRNRLRQALSTLRRLLEPPGDAPGSVLVADRLSIGLQAAAVECDVQRFEQHLRQGELAQAFEAYRGDLLPGFYDEWVEEERLRLRALVEAAREGAEGDEPPHPLARESAPPLPSMAATHSAPVRSLPASASLFFGREAEQRRVHDALATRRLVTLTGVGGCGKTRLAVEVARAAGGVDTVAFVALAECREPGGIGERIRAALRMRPSAEPAAAQLAVFLADRDVLLVLDNFEQLVEAGGAEVVLDLLGRLPRLRCLVTSRRVLDVADECAIGVGPLPLPDPGMAGAAAARTPSLALFVDRARGARPDFALTESNADALVRLARALEGLPLAIEIAASRVRAHSPEEMCAALSRRFELLARRGPRAARHGRHATLESTIEWSWQLLAPEQRRFLAALSVFRGGCTAASAGVVCTTLAAHEQLEALVADSLLVADIEAPGGTRFSMLETIREFAQDRLGDDRHAVRARHRAHALALARQLGAGAGPRLDAELPNLLQALTSAIDDGDPATAVGIGLALRAHWKARGMPAPVLQLLDRAQAGLAADDGTRARVLEMLSAIAYQGGDAATARRFAVAATERPTSDPAARAAALIALARLEWVNAQRPDEACRLVDQALGLARAAGAARVEADALNLHGAVVGRHGAADADHAASAALFERAETLYREAGDAASAHRSMLSRAGSLVALARYVDAGRLIDACEAYFGASRAQADLLVAANMRGFLESCQGHWPEALAVGRHCVRLAWESHLHLYLAMGLWNLPQPLTELGDSERAVRLKGFAERFWTRHIGVLGADDIASSASVRESAVERLGAVRVAALWDEGAALPVAAAVALALGTS